MDVHSSSLLIDAYALFSDVSLRRQASTTQAGEIPGPFFCSRAMLICSTGLVRKAMLRVVVLRVLFFVDEVAPYSVSLICIVQLFLR